MASGQQEHQPSPENEGQEQRQDFQESPTIPLQNSEDPHTETAPHHLMDVDRHVQEQASRRAELHTPEPRTSNDRLNGHRDHTDRSPSTPGHLAPFDWDDFESRYEQALAEANNEEKELLEEFERLVKVCLPNLLSQLLAHNLPLPAVLQRLGICSFSA